MHPIEKGIANLASTWLNQRQRARAQGGGLFYWLLAILGGAISTAQMIEIIQHHHLLDFPWDILVPLLLSLLWVRTAGYRLHPVKMFAATFFVAVAAAVYLGG